MSALSFIVLLLGGVSQILDLSAVVLCAMIIFVVYAELKYSAFLVYAVTLTLAFVIIPNKAIGVEYTIFAIYPVLKLLFEKTGKIVGAILKLIYILASSLTLTLLLRYVFMSQDVWYIDLVFGIGLVACCILFDIALTRFKLYYHYKLRRQLKIDRFFH